MCRERESINATSMFGDSCQQYVPGPRIEKEGVLTPISPPTASPDDAMRETIRRCMATGEALFKDRALRTLESCLARGLSLSAAIQAVRDMELL